ncbi:homologous recombination OB-fold protein [Syngnathus scovelli]|uniref:homologous recombination OB-fold protein n=1 Tax=Syngnathus scovelli TaxID=161590 RepID=UPI002110CDB5|nr:homologous recombination OB-fold protein [Syngnathus scovelli]
MSCHLGGLFSIGEDFDDEDLLGTHWAATVPSHPVDATRHSGTNLQRASTSETVAPTLRKLSSGARAFHRHLPVNPEPHEPRLGFGSRPAITRVPPREPGASLLQPNVESLLASNQLTPALQDLTSGAHFLRPSLPPALSLPKPHVGAQGSPGTNEPFRPLGRKTLRKPSSSAPACALPSPESDSGRANGQPCPVPTAVVAFRPLGATPVVTRGSGSNLLQPSDERPAHSLAPTARHVTEPPSGLLQKPSANVAAQDDFDDWDLDLADLEACERLAVPSGPLQALGGGTLRAPTSTATSLAPNTLSRSHGKPQRAARSTPGPSGPPRGLFETVSPALVPSPSSSPAFSPHPLSTPLLTNHLVQLVSASNKVSRKRPRSEPRPPKTRRFPGPAGLLPEEPPSRSLDEIVVSVPQIPAYGVAARLPHQVSCSQSEEEDFGGPWAAMKAEMGLDDRNPACFLCSFSVVMVLRKAALKQLNKNKVPNMAVMLKSITHTHADAKAVFRDPTGEIRGTVHRRLLEERFGELKVGAVLLLKQVGVFSPSHCNHYLNVTPNNLLRIYSPDGGCHKGQLPPPSVLEEPSPAVEPVSCMQLVFDDDNAGADDGTKCKDGSPQASGWDADDLDELLVALSEDTYSL